MIIYFYLYCMELLNTHPIKKSDLGFHGNLFGGKILAWVDSAASGLSMQLCDSPRLVTIWMNVGLLNLVKKVNY